ncbi:MAG: TetR/AcrR family transcriptional regulator [Rhodospirillales bacterium]|jgi:AcrR family transcriptional regulator
MPPIERPTNRDKILEAAMNLVRSQGVGKLTLEAAAKEAGVSKGGVLYHFPNKSALVRTMISRVIDQWERLQQSYYDIEPEGPYRWMRACVRASFDTDSPCCNDPVGSALLAGMAHDPDLIEPLRDKYREWMEKSMQDAPNPALMGVLGLMGDGLALHQLIGLEVLSPEQRDCIKNAALDLLK